MVHSNQKKSCLQEPPGGAQQPEVGLGADSRTARLCRSPVRDEIARRARFLKVSCLQGPRCVRTQQGPIRCVHHASDVTGLRLDGHGDLHQVRHEAERVAWMAMARADGRCCASAGWARRRRSAGDRQRQWALPRRHPEHPVWRVRLEALLAAQAWASASCMGWRHCWLHQDYCPKLLHTQQAQGGMGRGGPRGDVPGRGGPSCRWRTPRAGPRLQSHCPLWSRSGSGSARRAGHLRW